jgi:hypothetical protein
MPIHESFSEGLAGLELGGFTSRSNYPPTAISEKIDQTGSQRNFRPHNRQIDLLSFGE